MVIPFVATVVNLSRASDVAGGLRQATVTPGKEADVGRALGSASLSAFLIPPGVLLTVLCGLRITAEQRRRRPPPGG